MKRKINTARLHFIVIIAHLYLVPDVSLSQDRGIISEKIAVTARPSQDSITLRWAPLNVSVWQRGNQHGYRVERYTLVRDGSLLPEPQKTILARSVKPLPESEWEKPVQGSKYAAIAAQALFGERFEVNLRESNLFTIVNKVRENEQRFLFALFSADMSSAVARLSGLMFTDKLVNKGEKYLYRIIVHSMDSLRGSIFIGPDDRYSLPRPQNLKADFKDQYVSLRWDKNHSHYYTAYTVERSEDGKHFHSVSESPSVTVSPIEKEETRYEYAVDSAAGMSSPYHYRVRGLTAFGEQGPASEVITGKAIPSVTQVPYISAADNRDNRSVRVRWHFPDADNHAIKGFAVERSAHAKGSFKPLTEKLLPADSRMFDDNHPLQVNYYRVAAHGRDHAVYRSPVYFAQLIDSVPPTAPVGVEAIINDTGVVRLAWRPNPEPDIHGYRVYKAYHRSEELAQITESPVASPSFVDRVDLNTLNETVYYSVMALDSNQNHSALSDLLKVLLPDKVRPQPPVFLPPKGTAGGVSLCWLPGGSEDIVQYKLYRKNELTTEWEQLVVMRAVADSLYHFLDHTAPAGQASHYTLVAVDDAGLESAPAHPVSGSYADAALRPSITWKKPRVDGELDQITLHWEYQQPEAQSFRIFRAVNGHPPVLFQTVNGEQKQFTHRMVPGHRYGYWIMAVFPDGKKSLLSEEMKYEY